MKKTLTLLTILTLALITNCTYVQKIKDGSTAFDRKQYAVAIPMLKKEYNKSKSRVEKGKLAYMIGESYRNTSQLADAIQWYFTAYENSYGEDALKQYAFALKQNEQYDQAAQAFKDLGIEIGSPYEYRREITACRQAATWKNEGKNPAYEVGLSTFNSTNADYAPTLYENGRLVISSDRSTSTGDEVYNWTGNAFSDLFIVDPKLGDVTPFVAPINSVDHEGTVSFTADFQEMYFTRCSNSDKYADIYCAIYSSERQGDSWSEPIQVQLFEDATNVNYGDPSISKDGSTLYFSADHPEGWGGHDIYACDRTPDGWSEPQLLGRSINTPGNERFPFIDTDTLYFSSDYITGMGGLDIFSSYRMGERNWSPPQNLKAPVNSGSDDFGYTIDYAAQRDKDIIQKGYFCSSRQSGAGADDIYYFIEKIPPPPPPVDTTAPPEPIVYKILLEGYVLEKIYKEEDNPNSKVLGRKPLPGSTVDVKFGKETQQFKVGEDGKFSMELNRDTDYSFFGSKEGYLNNSTTFTTDGIGQDPANPVLTFTVEIELDRIFRNREIVLENIYYDFDKWDIRNDAKPTLNKLAETLRENPQINIELASHTDCRGQGRYNLNLSQRRAQSAVDYLISLGINEDRLGARGYGEEAPAVDCVCTRCSEEEHQSNRRTTFKIVE